MAEISRIMVHDKQMFHTLLAEMRADTCFVEPAAHSLILSRHLERLADHATNIAEEVIFLVKAKLVKHNAYQNLEL